MMYMNVINIYKSNEYTCTNDFSIIIDVCMRVSYDSQ